MDTRTLYNQYLTAINQLAEKSKGDWYQTTMRNSQIKNLNENITFLNCLDNPKAIANDIMAYRFQLYAVLPSVLHPEYKTLSNMLTDLFTSINTILHEKATV